MSVTDRWWQTTKRGDKKVRTKRPEYGTGQRWEVRWRDDAGQSHKKRFDLQDEARDWDATQRLTPKKRAAKMTVTDLHDLWLPTKRKLAAKTRQGYDSMWRTHIEPELGGRTVADLDLLEIVGWYNRIPSADSARQSLSILRGMLDIAVTADLLPVNPAKAIRGGQTTKRKIESLTTEQITALAQAIQPHSTEFWTLLTCGLRFGEMAGLSYEQVRDSDDGAWKILHVDRQVQRIGGETVWGLPKGGKERNVPLPGWLADRLERTGRLALPGPGGEPWTNDTWRTPWERARKAAGLPHLHSHDMRHVFAARQIEAGTDLKTLQVVMGHAHLSITTDLYGAMAAPKPRIADISGQAPPA